jgi:HK97 family phage major capsid protein/HK97 family phage prohead protease
MPVEITDKYIRVRVRNADDFTSGSLRTVWISEREGINSVQGHLRGEGTMTVQAFLFVKAKWDADRAVAWVRRHGYTPKGYDAMGEPDESLLLKGEMMPPAPASAEQFAEQVKFCTLSTIKVLDESERLIGGVASTPDKDDVGDIVVPTGISMKRYRQYPMVYYNHDRRRPPIGKTVGYEIGEAGLSPSIQISRTAEDIWQLILEKVLRAYSVGLWIRKYIIENENDPVECTRRITKSELFDISVCDIPVNRAVRLEVAKSLFAVVAGVPGGAPSPTGEKEERMEVDKAQLLTALKDPEVAKAVAGTIQEDAVKAAGDAAAAAVKAVAPVISQAAREAATDGVTALRSEITVMKGSMEQQMSTMRDALQNAAGKAELKAAQEAIKADLAPIITAVQRRAPASVLPLPDGTPVERFMYRAKRFDNAEAVVKSLAEEMSATAGQVRMLLARPGGMGGAEAAGLLKALQETSDFCLLVDAVVSAREKHQYRGMKSLRIYQHYVALAKEMESALKAMDTATTSEGLEWVPTMMSSDMQERVDLAQEVAGLFRSFPMPSKSYDWPYRGGRATAYLAGESVGDTSPALKASTPGTGKITFTADKFAVACLTSAEEVEDSIVATLDFLRDEIASAIARAKDACCVNGDDTATHLDTNVTTADDTLRAWKGFRAYCFDATRPTAVVLASRTASAGGAALTSALLRTIRSKIGARTVRLGDLRYLVSLADYVSLLSDTNMVTWDKFGPLATILTGVISAIDGVGVTITEHLAIDHAATGRYTGSGALSEALLVHRPSYMMGDRRAITVKSQELIRTDQVEIVATVRCDFKDIYQEYSATPSVICCSMLYNIAGH